MSVYTKSRIVGTLSFAIAVQFAWPVPQFGGRIAAANEPPSKASQLSGFEYVFPAMGTRVTFKAYASDAAAAEKAFTAAEERVLQLSAILTDYDPESETRQLTPAAATAPVVVSEPLWKVLSASQAWYQRSDGAFDASLGTLTRLWRKARRSGQVPTAEAIAEALQHAGWDKVQLEATARSVRFSDPELQLDFGAIGKGFVIDEAFAVLIAHGLTRCLVDVSGNMRCGDPPPERDGWRIAVSPLQRGGEPLRRIELQQAAIATSGDLSQYTIIDGVRRSHILDPKTGWGVPGPIAATVIAPTAMDADAAATVACGLDPHEIEKFWLELPQMALLLATLEEPSSQQAPSELAASGASDGKVHLLELGNFPVGH